MSHGIRPVTVAGPRWWRQVIRAGPMATLPRRLLLARGPGGSASVCLTFDDGPHPDYTPPLLDLLKDQRVTATFFVIGQRAARHPELVRRMAAEGHLVGNHSFTHSEPGATTARQLLDEVRQTRDLLAEILGEPTDLFRPPKGQVTAWKLWRLWRAGQTVVLWNADPKDFAQTSADAVRAWFRDRPVRGGDIVLMHDNHPHAAAVLPELIADARRRGLTFTTPAHWIKRVPLSSSCP